jgi:hypothetical protein
MRAPVLATNHLKGGTWTLGAIAVEVRPNEAAHRAKQTASRGDQVVSGPSFLSNEFRSSCRTEMTPRMERFLNIRCASAVQRSLVKSRAEVGPVT